MDNPWLSSKLPLQRTRNHDCQFRAIQINKSDKGQKLEFVELTEADLMPGDVTVAVEHSTVNYKDGLAVTGKAPIIRSFR